MSLVTRHWSPLCLLITFFLAAEACAQQPTVGFKDILKSVKENAGSLVVEVVLTGPDATETITVQYATQDGTAKAPDDYSNTSGTLTFPTGTRSLTITVPIVNRGHENSRYSPLPCNRN